LAEKRGSLEGVRERGFKGFGFWVSGSRIWVFGAVSFGGLGFEWDLGSGFWGLGLIIFLIFALGV